MRRISLLRNVVVAVVVAFGLLAAYAPSALADASAYPPANPLAGNAEAIEEGRKLYWKFCVQCHGANADGRSTRWGGYAKDLRKFWRGYGEFVVIVLNGRPKKQMPPWGGYLDEDQISQIGAYLETLAIEGAKWKN